jgi:asparagine synthase (glutamine-hydrolysing)
VAAEGDCWAALAGELLGRVELCRRLDLPPHAPPSAVVIAAWRRDPMGFVRELDGIFALVLFDGADLLLYRDPSGLRNLFWSRTRDAQLTFATDMQALLSMAGMKPRAAANSVHEYLRFLDITAPNTWYAGVRAVEPGRLVQLRTQGAQAVDPLDDRARDLPRGALVQPHFDDALSTLEGLLQGSIDERLADAERPSAFLSGGIDSSLICALAARSRADVTAITVGFDGEAYDEAPLAARIARHLGLRHEVLRFGHDEYVAAFDRLARNLEQPMADPATLATVLAFEHCQGRYHVVLDGTGADEAVGAIPPRHVRLAVQYGSLLPRALRRVLARMMRPVPVVAGYTPILDFDHPADTMMRWRGFTRTEIEELCGEPVSFAQTTFYRTFARFPRHAHFDRYSALVNTMSSDRLGQAMRTTGYHHVRLPFFDHETDQFIRQLPRDFRYLPGEPKRILRALLARHVPREIWDAPKHGFNFPLGEFLTARNHELVRRYLLDSDVWRHTKLLSAEGVQRYGRQFIAGDRQLTFRVWALAVLGAWLEHDET